MNRIDLSPLTFTRFIAASWVVLFHFGKHTWPFEQPLVRDVVVAGPTAVTYFFVLSGFIMTVVYRQRLGTWAAARRYWWARVARIYPLYAFALVAAILVTNGWPGLASVAATATLLQAWLPGHALDINGPAWSLSVEAFFYATFPLMLVWFERLRLRRIMMLALLAWVLAQGLHALLVNAMTDIEDATGPEWLAYHPLFHWTSFILGMTAGAIVTRVQWRVPDRLPDVIVVACVGITCAVCIYHADLMEATGVSFWIATGLLAPLFAIGIAALAWSRGVLHRLMRLRGAILLGEASYALYLLQIPVWIAFDRGLGFDAKRLGALELLVYFAALTGLSLLAYVAIERPARAALRRRHVGGEAPAFPGAPPRSVARDQSLASRGSRT